MTTEKETEETTIREGFIEIDGFLVYVGETTTDANYNKMIYRDDLAKECFEQIKDFRLWKENERYVDKHPVWDERLVEVAKKRCKEIIKDFSHNSKGDLYKDFLNHGEYLALLSEDQNAFKCWYNSDGHRMNMLGISNVGIACLEYQGNQYWAYVCADTPYLKS